MNPTQANPQKGPRFTTVVVEGIVNTTGEKIVAEIPIPHEPGVAEPLIINAAITVIRQGGGVVTDGEKGSVNFYPLSSLKLNFRTKAVQLASAMPGPRLM